MNAYVCMYVPFKLSQDVDQYCPVINDSGYVPLNFTHGKLVAMSIVYLETQAQLVNNLHVHTYVHTSLHVPVHVHA